MEICKVCGSTENIYKKSQICKKCYQKQYSKKYYQENSEIIKKNSSKNYYDNHDKNLEYRKKIREEQQFNSKREKILQRDNYTCFRCNKQLESKLLIVHHKDRLGRGSKVKNNDDSNLETLCRSCHAREHNKDLKTALADKYSGKWSMKYDKCIVCGTTSVKHQGKGMCSNCYARFKRQVKI